jgi:hypothetical protein
MAWQQQGQQIVHHYNLPLVQKYYVLNIKHFLKDIGMAYQEFPTQIILQLLKHSETNKEQAITHLTKLFVELKIPHLNTYQGSKEFVENHLKHPYLTEKELSRNE